jgi:hypothetical protein
METLSMGVRNNKTYVADIIVIIKIKFLTTVINLP